MDRLLAHRDAAGLVERYGRERVTAALRSAVDEARRRLGEDPRALRNPEDPGTYLDEARRRLEADAVPSLRRVINATGVLLHTNLGRAPLAAEAREALAQVATGYANLEFDLEQGERGSRYVHCASLLAGLTGAGDALVVNNCAAALVLAVNTLAAGREVAVSRGELVEIGGGFRIPDMLARAGARLVEVGTTNRTRVADYARALDDGDVALVLKVHRSNFRVSGFTEEASLDELVTLGRERDVPVVHDVGSGILLDPGAVGLPPEPTPAASVGAGATLAVFSGDKLLGGPQAGCMVGRADAVAALRKNPLCRALRVDKGTLAALEATLRLYGDPDTVTRRVPVLRMLTAVPEDLRARAEVLAESLRRAGAATRVEPGMAVVGGGTFPGHEMPSWTVRIAGDEDLAAETLARRLRDGMPPVVGRVEEGTLVLDVRTVQPGEDGTLAETVRRALGAEA